MRLKTVVGFATGPVLAAVLSSIALPLIAWAFDPADIGRFNVLQTLIPLFLNGVFLGLDQAYVREFHESADRHRLYASMAVPSLAICLLAFVVVAFNPSWWAQLLYGVNDSWLIWGTLLSLLCTLTLRQWMLAARMRELSTMFSLGQMLPRLFQILGLVLIVALSVTRDFELLMVLFVASCILTNIAIAAGTWRFWFKRSAWHVSLTVLRRMLSYSVVLAVAAFAYVALSSVGTFAMRAQSDYSSLGVYAMAISIAGIATIVQSVFSIVWSPIIFKALAESRGETMIEGAQAAIITMFGVVVAICGGFSWLVAYVLPAEYGNVSFLVIGTVFVPLVYMVREVSGIGIIITRRTQFSLYVTLACLAFCVATSFAGAWAFGATGVTAASVVSFWLLFVSTTEISNRIWFRTDRVRMHVIVGAAAILVVASLWIGALGQTWFHWLWLGYGALITIMQRKEIVNIYSSLTSRLGGRPRE